MTDTTLLPPDGTVGTVADVRDLDVRDLDVRGVLDLLVGQRRAGDAGGGGDLLVGVVQLVDLFPVLDPEDAAYVASNDRPLTAAEAGPTTRVPIAGTGCPRVHADGVAALGAALGVPYRAALGLVGETLELCYRLPRLWGLVQDGRLQAWKARRVARETHLLSVAAVEFVDRHLAVTGVRNHIPANLGPIVTMALNRCDPEIAEGREEAALAGRHVSFAYSASTDTGATADLIARLDLLDALDLDQQISAMATAMGHLGDTDTLDIRRAHALGMLADPQHTLTIFSTDTPAHTETTLDTTTTGAATGTCTGSTAPTGSTGSAQSTGSTGSAGLAESAVRGVRGGMGGRLHATGATLYLHITAADLAAIHTDVHGNRADAYADRDGDADAHVDADPDPDTGAGAGAGASAGGAARVEKLNAVTLTLLRDWLRRTDHVTIRPVLEMTRADALDPHDPPGWMRETVILRDQTCVFPGCTTDARSCDQDHITPYQPMDQGGPPGQTSLANLASLCRRHHGLKTRRVWAYRRLPDNGYDRYSSYEWTSPHGHVYLTRPGARPDRT